MVQSGFTLYGAIVQSGRRSFLLCPLLRTCTCCGPGPSHYLFTKHRKAFPWLDSTQDPEKGRSSEGSIVETAPSDIGLFTRKWGTHMVSHSCDSAVTLVHTP